MNNLDSTESIRPVHWGYGSNDGPNRWAALSPAYAKCGQGRRQSPINIVELSQDNRQIWEADYGSIELDVTHNEQVVDIVDNGHTIQVEGDQTSSIVLAGISYALEQIHFHTPSEHMLNGKQYPLEMHLVHRSRKGSFAVLGVLFEEGAYNVHFETLIENLPDRPGEKRHLEHITIDINSIIPANPIAYHYSGSLTTPPCLEGVEWIVAAKKLQMSSDQLQEFTQRLHNNYRPIQPFNQRSVTLIQGQINKE